MSAVGVLVLVASLRWAPPVAPHSIPWWVLVPAMAGANALVFHLEFRGEAHTFTLSEISVVVGFFFAPAHVVILSRICGCAIHQLFRRRQLGLKLVFNLADFAMEAGLVVGLLHFLVGGRRPDAPITWVLTFASVVTGELLVMLAVSSVISWHGGKPHIKAATVTSAAIGLVTTSLGLLATYLLWHSPPTLALLGIVLLVSFAAYRAYFTLTKRYASLQLLYEFTKVVSGSMRAQAVLDEILAKARQLLLAEVAQVILFDPHTGLPTVTQSNTEAGEGHPLGGESSEHDLGPVWRQVVQGGRAVVVPRTTRSPELQAIREALDVKDVLLAPLRSEEGVVGVIFVANRLSQVSSFEEEDCRLFETLANHASVAFDNSRLVEQLRQEADERRHEAEERRYEALHDSLTGLPNRTHFAQRVQDLLAAGGEAAVMLMDLDRFKEVNDTLGHHHGDLLLSEVAGRLLAALPPAAMAARLGGDEFAVLVPGVAGSAEVQDVAEGILQRFDLPFVIDELPLNIGASVGIAVAPLDGTDAITLLQRADVAMYEAKGARSGWARYSLERDTYTPRRLALIGGLRQAIDDRDIVVHFQPKAHLSDGTVMSAEALVRWRHRELGMVFPDEFIPIAEQTGLEPQLTSYVLRAALRQCANWHRGGHAVGVAVNLAVRSLLDANLPESVSRMIEESGVPPSDLTLEITESSVMADPDRTIGVLNRLAAIGVRLSVDDFGTGYSSLSYLQKLPVHEVKIDKSFVFRMATDHHDAVIVDSIVDLGHKLGLSVVAEGVEDQVSWDRLRAMSCDVAQGYHLSKPIPGPALTRWLDERRLLARREDSQVSGATLDAPAIAG